MSPRAAWSRLDRRTRRRWRNNLLLALLFVLVALPSLTSAWTAHRVGAEGVEVTATAIGANAAGGDYGVVFRFAPAVDPDQRAWSATVDAATYATAQRTRRVQVRVLPGHPSTYRVAGEVRSSAGLVVTVAAEVIIMMLGVILWRAGARPRAETLHLVALAAVVPGGDDDGPDDVEERPDHTYVAAGRVVEITRGGIALQCGERLVVVDLDGRANPVGVQEPARVWGRLPESTP